MPLLSDVEFIFKSTVAVSTPNEQFLGCASVAFSERNVLSQWNTLQPLCSWSGYGPRCNSDVNITEQYMIKRR